MTENPATGNPATVADFERLCVHQLVEARAAAHPERVAVVCGETVLSYGELDERADALARRLGGLGFDRPAVGLLLPRSVDFVVAALAVLKAGGHYVPLDADYPAERLRFMLTAARCPVVLSRTALLDRLPEDCGARAVCLDAPAGEPPADAALPSVDPADLVYTMFTSGSTGVPKGVMITHRGVVRLVSPPGIIPLDGDAVVLHASSTSFDATTFDIWATLANGARLVVAPPGRLSAMEVGALLRAHRVTSVLLPTGLFHLMLDERPADLAGLRRLVVGGDVLSAKHARRFLQEVPGCELVNAYGPTEVSVAITTHRLAADQDADESVPIGRPMEGTYVRVLGADLEPVPAGESGQLYAGGPGLARGYLGDAALTAERFVPDPWLPGARLYATGDLVLQRPDGALDFLGRIDDQFKKRGFRVEPAEVEAALRADPAVRDAAVLADGATADTRRLVAVLAPAPGQPAESLVDLVRTRLRKTLPDYLIPDVWGVADTFPLTANGKVDRQALLRLAIEGAVRPPDPPVLDADAGGGEGAAAARGMDAEEVVLAEIWREVLGLDRVGPEEDFFDLGGHSLLANRVVSQIRRRMGVKVPLAAVFDHSTITALAAVVRTARSDPATR